jgi:arylsulfatase
LARQKKLGIAPADTQLTARNPLVPAWDSLNPQQKQLYAYMMEIYAGYLSQTDYNAGRVLDAIEQLGQLDNTIVIYMCGDNGASAEGRKNGLLNEFTSLNGIQEDFDNIYKRKDDLGTWKTHNHYPVGWAMAMDSPFQWAKMFASHYGGTRNGMVISWPARIKDQGGIRTQWHHTIDVVPTILDVAGVQQPSVVNGVAQKPMEGVSMAYTFEDAKAASTRRTQYFEIFGNRAIYHDGWVACTTPRLEIEMGFPVDPVSGYKWELYHVAEDYSEAVNVADKYPDKLHELQLLFYAEAAKYNVLPLDNRALARMDTTNRPNLTRGRTQFTYFGTLTRIPEGAAPDIKNKSFRITANVELKKSNEEGVLVTQGGLSGGYALMLRGGKPVFHYNYADLGHYNIAAKDALAPGKHTIVFDFKYDGGGMGKGGAGTISVDGKQVADGHVDHTMPLRLSFDETFDVGEDTGTPVSLDYDVPFKFTGALEKLVIDLKPQDAGTQAEEEKYKHDSQEERAIQAMD